MTETSFGARLAAARRAKGISQEELARLVHLTSGTISKYERNALEPGMANLVNLARSLDVPIDSLVQLHVPAPAADDARGQ